MATQGEFFEKPAAILLAGPDEGLSLDETTTEILPSITTSSVGLVQTYVAPPQRQRLTMKDLSIPKLYYSISEVSRLTGIEPYVLRYWESEFHELKPQKNRAGNRTYSNRDIKFILRIKDLLREKRYTIEGAKNILHSERGMVESKEETASTAVNDPAQIAMPTETKVPTVPQSYLTLTEIHGMKESLAALKTLLMKHA